MLKQDVTYKDPLTDEKVTETLHFNLSKAELAEMLVIDPEYPNRLQEIAKREDPQELVDTIKELVRRSYGEVVEVDGRKRFFKSEATSEAFLGTEAYSEFFFGLFTDLSRATAFVNGVMPADLLDGSALEAAPAPQAPRRPVPQDRLPKRVKTVEVSADQFEEVSDVEVVDANPEVDEKANRVKELLSKSFSELTLDELIELKQLQQES